MKRKEIISHLKRIESLAYPLEYQQMQDGSTWGDLTDYCEGTPHVEVWEGGYCIWTKDEIVDIATIKSMSLEQINLLLKKLKTFFGDKVVTADLREKTSYRLCKLLEKRRRLTFMKEEVYEWGGENFYEVKLKFL